MEPNVVGYAKDLRAQCKSLESIMRKMMTHDDFGHEQAYEGQHSEMKSHIMLAVRHMEDARMRLGKVCQYADDGVSIFDKM